jgi:orotate phosphoribosyltransferase
MADTEQLADISWLFESNALEIAPWDRPFLYTSGLIGPYFINTHYLCGGMARAKEVLAFIDEEQLDKQRFPSRLTPILKEVYDSSAIYRGVVDAMCEIVRTALPLDEVDGVSGGQRRDWFFAPLVAQRLGKPCFYLYNDLSLIDERGDAVTELPDAAVLNVADLLTVGSSYTKKWAPALRQIGARLRWSLVGVDRNQGGADNLHSAGVERCESLFSVDASLFDRALALGLIDRQQHLQLTRYLEDPFSSMRGFLLEHPEFLQQATGSPQGKTAARARLLEEQDLYRLRKS